MTFYDTNYTLLIHASMFFYKYVDKTCCHRIVIYTAVLIHAVGFCKYVDKTYEFQF